MDRDRIPVRAGSSCALDATPEDGNDLDGEPDPEEESYTHNPTRDHSPGMRARRHRHFEGRRMRVLQILHYRLAEPLQLDVIAPHDCPHASGRSLQIDRKGCDASAR